MVLVLGVRNSGNNHAEYAQESMFAENFSSECIMNSIQIINDLYRGKEDGDYLFTQPCDYL